MKRILYLIFIIVAALACDDDFEAPPQSLLKATLLNSTTNKSDTSIVTARGIGLDSLYYNKVSLSELVLPLSAKDTTKYVITFDSDTDTITFIHDTSMKYQAMETGFYYEYKLRKIDFSKHRIDSILITDSLVTTIWHENIKLYIHL